jgi:CRP-like cAMP-binding protein
MKQKLTADANALRARFGAEGTTLNYRRGQVIFAQGAPGDAVFSIQKGKVKLAVISAQNKEAVTAILSAGDLIGEACLAGQSARVVTATALTGCTVSRLSKPGMMRLLQEDAPFSELLLSYVLLRNIRIEEDLVDHLFNSSEKRLARVLLRLANFGKEGKPEFVIQNVSQETLAGLVGTTRSRISYFMNKFRKLGFIDYNGSIEVHSSLLNVVIRD